MIKSRRSMTNLHNEHIYVDENPHATKVVHYLVWAGIIDSFIPLVLSQFIFTFSLLACCFVIGIFKKKLIME